MCQRTLYCILLLGVMLPPLVSCTQNVPYHHFEATQNEGWDKEDTLNFSVDTIEESGRYTLTLETRVSDLYPYRNLSLNVEETIYKAGVKSQVSRCFSVEFEPRAVDGSFEGLGMSQHDLSKVLALQYLHHGDSLHLKVWHRMRRQVLPGITNVGVKLTNNN